MRSVQARLDEATERELDRLVRQLGWSSSRVVREAIRVLAASHPRPGRKRIMGLGQFDSGIPDLGSNKAHLEGFGR